MFHREFFQIGEFVGAAESPLLFECACGPIYVANSGLGRPIARDSPTRESRPARMGNYSRDMMANVFGREAQFMKGWQILLRV